MRRREMRSIWPISKSAYLTIARAKSDKPAPNLSTQLPAITRKTPDETGNFGALHFDTPAILSTARAVKRLQLEKKCQ